MTQEEKQLLLQDLSARLPYGVFCAGITYELDDDGEKYIPVKVKDTLTEIHNYNLETASVKLDLISSCKLETVKPYLRLLSDMTEEEEKEFEKVFELELKAIEAPEGHTIVSAASSTFEIDFYNNHHFDYRGLIPKGLAIKVTEENNPYKE